MFSREQGPPGLIASTLISRIQGGGGGWYFKLVEKTFITTHSEAQGKMFIKKGSFH
jgi:hypothetical protein